MLIGRNEARSEIRVKNLGGAAEVVYLSSDQLSSGGVAISGWRLIPADGVLTLAVQTEVWAYTQEAVPPTIQVLEIYTVDL